jgi:hypothetical protein
MPHLDLNGVKFQDRFFTLEKSELLAALKTFRKLRTLSWQQVYRDSGLNWEASGDDMYSIRITQKCRALVRRVGDTVQFLSLHPDHDSAYDH